MNKKPPSDEEAESYSNDEGFTIFTEEYLLKRGYCCGNACRNCPYDYINVTEPRRTFLLQQRKANDKNT
ncbi:MAG TPA: DUF5522 domain-containing protein [Flavitalea sp.]|nr:DUF5522 domain-containing protein [Flavitalea sp.]